MIARTLAQALLALLVAAVPAPAQDAPASDTLTIDASEQVDPQGLKHLRMVLRVLRGETIEFDPNGFTPTLRERTPVIELQRALEQLAHNSGGYVNLGIIDHGPGIITTVVRSHDSQARARLSITYETGGAFRIDGILVHPDLPTFDSWAQFTEALDAFGLDASVSLAEILEDGSAETLFTYHEDRSLAVAYHARLFVLDALVRRIDSGEADWLDTVVIREELKTFPPGSTATEPAGGALPISRLTQRMIVETDHTATDHLIDHLGRDAVEDAVRDRVRRVARNIPFLFTREAFNLRLILTETFIEQWAESDDDEQRDMLPTIDRIEVADVVYQTWRLPVAVPVVGWFASAKEMNDLFSSLYTSGTNPRHVTLGGVVNELPPAPVDPTVWVSSKVLTSIEPGIVATTWLLAHRDGRRYVLTGVFNSPSQPIPADQVGALLIAAAETLGRTPPRVEDEPVPGGESGAAPE
ncbi:unnamed protein product [Symbiodinium necroappetens]|uniref:Beta-lactamase class A catalytic domain-containing protein n=1 Tax=Symbiodinium necroappetens TaxID=1628268 RepID=A0A812QV15_9DINO|nr:unnamed protein product [Symbiodinium necroappetens]